MGETRVTFSNLVTVHCAGRPVDAPARRSDWVEWEALTEIATMKPDLYSGAEIVIGSMGPGALRIRYMRTSAFGRDTVPYLVAQTLDEGGFTVTVNDPNTDTKMTITTDRGVVSKWPTDQRGGPELTEGEVEILGVWKRL